MSEMYFKINRGKDSFVAIGLYTVRAYGCAHDVEMGIIDRIDFLRGRGYDTEGLRIYHLVTPVSRFPDFAHSDTAVDAGNTHSRAGRYGTLGSIFGQGCGRGVYS
jgi:hypothetical protein